MRNINKANKAFEKICVMAFLEGRRCSLVDGIYHEGYLGGEIELFVYQDEVDGRISIRGQKSFGGWYDSIRFDIASLMTVTDICASLIDILDSFRRWVRESESKFMKEARIIKVNN